MTKEKVWLPFDGTWMLVVSRSQTTIFFFCVGARKNRVWYNCVTISVLTFHYYRVSVDW